jgi:hypothetical protein
MFIKDLNTKDLNTKESNTKESNTKESNTKESTTKESTTKESNTKESTTKSINDVKMKPIKKRNTPEFFIPKEKDTLFWCFFLMKYGDIAYESSPKHIVEEKRIKIEYVDKMRDKKALLKKYKISTLTNVENQLVNEFKIDISTFFSLCLIENINIFYIHNKCFYEFMTEDDENTKTYIIKRLDQPIKYGMKELNMDVEKDLEKYRTSLFKMDKMDKPIKSISSYKLIELQDICQKLGLDIVDKESLKKKNKNELYESIIQYF